MDTACGYWPTTRLTGASLTIIGLFCERHDRDRIAVKPYVYQFLLFKIAFAIYRYDGTGQ
jgi:hypothetical protein